MLYRRVLWASEDADTLKFHYTEIILTYEHTIIIHQRQSHCCVPVIIYESSSFD